MSLAMSKMEREAFLADVHVGIIAIPRAGAGPMAVPIWYDYEPGGAVRIITNLSSRKGKLLQDCERISLVAQTESLPYRYVSVEGPFTTTPTKPNELLEMAVRYLGELQGKAYAGGNSDEAGDSVVIHLTPERWLSVDYAKA